MVYSLLWVMQDLYHQPYFKALGPKHPIIEGFLGYFAAKGKHLSALEPLSASASSRITHSKPQIPEHQSSESHYKQPEANLVLQAPKDTLASKTRFKPKSPNLEIRP